MKKFFNVVLVILCILSVASYFFSDWIEKNYKDHFAYQTNYWQMNTSPDSSITADEDTAFTFVVNYYANEDNSGIEMYELKLNYYTDYKFQDIYSLGIQILKPQTTIKFTTKYEAKNNLFGDFHAYYKYNVEFDEDNVKYFNTDDGVSFNSVETFNSREVPYIIKINEQPYAFDFDKDVVNKKNQSFLYKNYYEHKQSSFGYFLYNIFDSTTHITDGDGTYRNLKLELMDIFNIYEYNGTTGKFDKLSTFGYDVNYISFKVNYHKRGAMTHSDSLFNQIGNYTSGGVIWGNS